MKKKVITIMAVLIFAILAGVTFVFPERIKNNNTSDAAKIINTDSENSTLDDQSKNKIVEDGKKFKNPQFGDIITVKIPKEQIVPMHTWTLIQDTLYRDLEYMVDAAYATKKLPDGYDAKESTRNIYGYDTIDGEGTILKDWYYVIVDISVRNSGEKDNILIPNNTQVIFIDKDSMATDNTKIQKNSITYKETSENKRFNELKYIPDFKPGEAAHYQQIFLVQDKEVESDSVYIRATYGVRGERILADNDQRYIKLELEVQ